MAGTKISNLTLTTVGASDELPITRSGANFKVNLRTAITSTLNSTNLSGLAASTSAQLATIIADETGSGALVFATSPTLVTPNLGTPSAGNLSNCTLYPVGSLSGLGSGVATFLATPSSANLASAITNETGSGSLVFATSPTLVTPLLGTPTSGNLSNCTNYAISNLASIASGMATFLTTPSSANLAATITNETGSGSLVFSSSPSLNSPILANAVCTGNITITGCSVDFTGGGDTTFNTTGTTSVTLPTSGTLLSSSGTSTGGNASSDSGKTVIFDSNGSLKAKELTLGKGTVTRARGQINFYDLSANLLTLRPTTSIGASSVIVTIPSEEDSTLLCSANQSFGGNGGLDEGFVASYDINGSLTTQDIIAQGKATIGGDGTQGEVVIRDTGNRKATLRPTLLTADREYDFPNNSGLLLMGRVVDVNLPGIATSVSSPSLNSGEYVAAVTAMASSPVPFGGTDGSSLYFSFNGNGSDVTLKVLIVQA